MTKRILGTACLVFVWLLVGCASTTMRTYARPAAGQRQYGKVKKVAVLPFDSVAEGAAIPKGVGDIYLQELLTRRTFEVVEEPRYVAALMKKLKLRNTEELDREIVRKIGEELKAEALIVGLILMFGEEKVSEVTEFAMRSNMLDVETGEVMWSGQTYVATSTSLGEVLGVNKGPSPNAVAKQGVSSLVRKLDGDFRSAREAEIQRMLEAAKAQKASEEGLLPPEEEAPTGKVGAPGAAPAPPKEQEGEEILLQVKPK